MKQENVQYLYYVHSNKIENKSYSSLILVDPAANIANKYLSAQECHIKSDPGRKRFSLHSTSAQ